MDSKKLNELKQAMEGVVKLAKEIWPESRPHLDLYIHSVDVENMPEGATLTKGDSGKKYLSASIMDHKTDDGWLEVTLFTI